MTALLKRIFANGSAPIAVHRLLIDKLFAHDSVEEIVAALDSDGGGFAQATRAAILEKSPRGLKITLKLLRLGRASPSLKESLVQEYRAVCEAYITHDFVEGIRAAIIDKDRDPKWLPPRLEDITPQIIEKYLAPKGLDELTF